MVVGTFSLVQNGQISGCSTQWIQWNSDIWWLGLSRNTMLLQEANLEMESHFEIS